MKKFLLAAYRDWAKDACLELRRRHGDVYFEVVDTEPRLERRAQEDQWDAVVLIGWSWKVPADVVNSTLVVGMHPSDLPKYAGGSPIQHQVIDGLATSQATLFRLNERFDAGELIDKEPYSLDGHLFDLLRSLSTASVAVIGRFIDRYPQVSLAPQGPGGFTRKRLKPEQSQLTRGQLSEMSCKQLYDFIRCHEDPYPNATLSDDTGTLVFKRVDFVSRQP